MGVSFPSSFLWGVATAGHQIEGNNVNSDYWLLEHLEPTTFKEPSGDACDSWERWPEDVELVRGLGLNTYRFSLEWARIEPEEGRFSAAVLDHYRRICGSLREAGISPVPTFHHFTSPRWLAMRGGWEDAGTPERFARYCERAARTLGDLIDFACTINEPNAQVNSYILRGERPFGGEDEVVAAACRATGADRFNAYFMGNSYRVRDVCIASHARAVEAIRGVAPLVKTGMTLALQALERGEDGDALYEQLFKEARRPFYEACARDDFIGVQAYNRVRTGPRGYHPARQGAEVDQWGMEAPADVLEAAVREAWTECGAPILISEHGINTSDDAQRLRHLSGSLRGVQACLTDGIPVLGYIHWSLLDNFEWRSGYEPKFGLYAVDRSTFARTAKPSAAAYAKLVDDLRAMRDTSAEAR
jgi:beta-glucosidase